MIEYLIQSIASMAISYLVFKIFLEHTWSLKFNRGYLLTTLVLGIFGPMITLSPNFTPVQILEIYPSTSIGNWVPEQHEILSGELVQNYTAYPDKIGVKIVGWSLYSLLTITFCIRFGINLHRLTKSLKKVEQLENGMQLAVLKCKTSPYSFFNYLVVSEDLYKSGSISKSIMDHELLHKQQYHSIDILLIELIKCLFWFNPFVWLYSRLVTENHEYHADYFTIRQGISRWGYATELLNVSHYNISKLSNGFSYTSLKKRIKMMNKNKVNPLTQFARISVSLIILIFFFMAGGFTSQESSKPFIVVIDAGHGGKDAGAMINKFSEKEIVLQICKSVAQQLDNHPVQLILTRNDDKFLSLDQRIEIINHYKPDLLLSVHVNGSLANNDRLNAFYYNGKYGAESENFSKIFITKSIAQIVKSGAVMEADYYLLKNVQSASILLEFGENVMTTDDQNVSQFIAETLLDIQKGTIMR